MNIVVADDDLVALQMVSHALRGAGHTVRLARNGLEAQTLITESRPDVVFTDWNMPGCDGMELCGWIRERFASPYVYVILFTARDTVADAVRALSDGADDFVRKPIEAAEIVARAKAAERVLSLEARQLTILALAKLAESRDPETGEHLERVSAYVRILHEGLMNASLYAKEAASIDIEVLELASCLHDIGKVGIPDSILLKPGRLSDNEYNMMKEHTLIGASALVSAVSAEQSSAFLTMAHDIALTHHERYDGGGYPNGLAGTDIPLTGRIMALADVYDALTSSRVYRGAMIHSAAHQVIIAERGKQLDPVLVDVYLAREGEFEAESTRLLN